MSSDDLARCHAATDLDHSYLVEAAAGTGKTTLLIARLLNVICSGEAPMDKIVAITFTEKAAGELKAKLRDGIEEAISTGVVGRDPYARNLSEDEQRRLREALRELDRAQVTTIHAFCQAMIRERPVEAGIDPQADIASPLMQSLLLEEAWERWRDTTLSQDAAPGSASSDIAEALRAGIPLEPWEARGDSIRTLFYALARHRDCVELTPPLLDEEAEWRTAAQRLTAAVQPIRDGLAHNKKPDKRAEIALAVLDTIREAVGESPAEARQRLLALEIPKDRDLGSGVKSWRSEVAFEQMGTLLAAARDVHLPAALSVLTHNVMVRLLHQARSFLDTFQQLKSDRGALDFDDLLIVARNMLRDHAEARRYFKRKFAFILLDEFQDTDPLQAEIAFFLAQADAPAGARGDDDERDWTKVRVQPGKLFLVGDPKQSIYRFRRADIEVYQECGDLVAAGFTPAVVAALQPAGFTPAVVAGLQPAGVKPAATTSTSPASTLHISRNFRSGRCLLDFVNSVFTEHLQPPADGNYQPRYVPLEPGPLAESFAGEVVLLYPPDQDGAEGRIDRIRYREGCCFAQLIHRAVQEQWLTSRGAPLRYGDIAILLRSFTGIDEYERALRACDVPYRMAGGKHFYQRLEIKSLIAAVNAIDSPEDQVAVVAALRSAFFGISDEDLLRHVAAGQSFNYMKEKQPPGALAEPFALLRELHKERNRRPVAVTVQKLCEATKILVMFLLKPQGEQRVANLLKVIETARSLESTGAGAHGGALTFRAFARWLRDREQAEEEEAESPLGEVDDDFVQMMTIHKAKGLEFEMVIVADLNNEGTDKPDPLIVDRVQRKLEAGQSKVGTAAFPAATAWEKLRRDAEFVRLFYVALTRAKSRIVLPVCWKKEPEGFQQLLDGHIPSKADFELWASTGVLTTAVPAGFRCVDTSALKGAGWPTPSESFRVKLDWESSGGKPARELLAERQRWGEELRAATSAASAGARLRTPSGDHDELEFVARDGIDPGGRRFGRLVHRGLELCLAERELPSVKGVIRRAAGELGANEKDAAAAVEMVAKTAASPIFERLRAAKRVFCEVPFVFDEGEGLVEGVIDLVAEEDDGLVIVDWKTDNYDTLTDDVLARYAAQLRDYAAAAERATGKPVTELALYFVRNQHAEPINPAGPSARASSAPARQLRLNLS